MSALISESPAQRLLARLDRVRETAPGDWLTSCPGPLHDRSDRHPSLSIKETADGTLLLHCFAGCPVHAVLAAVGMQMSDLFPAKLDNRPALRPAQRKRYGQAIDASKAIKHEALIVSVAAGQLGSGNTLKAEDRNRLNLARDRIEKAAEVTA